MPICTVCGTEKDSSEFYKNCRKKTGHNPECKTCAKQYVSARRITNPEAFERIEKRRNAKSKRVNKNMAYTRMSCLRNPEKRKAKDAVHNALKAGKIIRPKNCEVCTSEKNIQAHHTDYKFPLLVVWLCKKCHSEVHKCQT